MVIHNIFFKLSTTRQNVDSEIIQISALTESLTDEKKFHCFVKTSKNISSAATDLHKIYKNGNGDFYQSRPRDGGLREEVFLDMQEPEEALRAFFGWLENIKIDRHDKIRLVSHGAHSFHAQVLVIFNFSLR